MCRLPPHCRCSGGPITTQSPFGIWVGIPGFWSERAELPSLDLTINLHSEFDKSHKVSPLAFRLLENALDQWVCWGPSQKPPSLVAVHPLVDPKLHTQFWTCWTNPGLKHKVGGAGSTSRAPKTSLCCSPATSSLTETEFTKVGGFQSVKSGAGERHKKTLDPSPSARVRHESFASEDDYQTE